MSNQRSRLDRLVLLTRPKGCHVVGRECWRNEVYGDGTDDPPLPLLPERCPACGLPRSYQLVCVAGVDANLI